MRKIVSQAITSSLLLAAVLLGRADAGEPWKTGSPFVCSADNIGATLTEVVGCGVTSATPPLRYYIQWVAAQSTTATGGQFALRSGTGTNCGTGTLNVLPANVATARYSSPANTAASTMLFFDPPLAVTAGHAVCVLGVATNTTTITVSGWLAP